MSSNNELLEALNILEREKNISKETLLEAIENSLVTACKNHFGTSENVKVTMDPQTCEYHVFQEKTVVEQVEDPVEQISLVNAKMVDSKYEIGDIVNVEIQSKEFGRIATQNAKNVILQKIRFIQPVLQHGKGCCDRCGTALHRKKRERQPWQGGCDPD